MNQESKVLLALYDHLAGLVEKLPGGLHKPILRELMPIRDVFLKQRAPRIVLVGASDCSAPSLLAMMGVNQIHVGEAVAGWRSYQGGSAGATAVILDARNDAPENHWKAGIAARTPDLVLLVQDGAMSSADWDTAIQRASASGAPIIALALRPELEGGLAARLDAYPALEGKLRAVFSAGDPAFLETFCATLPAEGQLEFARLTNARRAQAYIASSLLKSFSAMCGVIGLQPIPLADLPILSTLQSLMVGMIIHTTGRPVTLKLVGEFLGTLGASVAAGFVFREAARAAVKIVPFWGNAVSGVVAGAGTYAIGRAAIAYFIDDSPIQETRRIFRSMLPQGGRSKQLP